MTEEQKMKAGEWYNANYDKHLLDERTHAMDLCYELNCIRPSDEIQRQQKLEELLGYKPEELAISSPFFCDYGTNIRFGKKVFVNLNCYFMDGAPITIGDYAFIGPSCGFYTANHPLSYRERDQGLEQAKAITIGDHVWLGANVTVLPGVTIGTGCVIAAGSVVTADIPDHSLAGGVPCRVIRKIDPND